MARILPSHINVGLTKISQYLARLIWWGMLWLMRRKWMKALQRNIPAIFPARIRESARRSVNRQNAFARKYGLAWLTGVILFFVASVGTTWCYEAAIYAVDSGMLKPPARMVGNLGEAE